MFKKKLMTFIGARVKLLKNMDQKNETENGRWVIIEEFSIIDGTCYDSIKITFNPWMVDAERIRYMTIR